MANRYFGDTLFLCAISKLSNIGSLVWSGVESLLPWFSKLVGSTFFTLVVSAGRDCDFQGEALELSGIRGSHGLGILGKC